MSDGGCTANATPGVSDRLYRFANQSAASSVSGTDCSKADTPLASIVSDTCSVQAGLASSMSATLV